MDGDNEDKRDLQTLFTQQELAILSVDADEGNGELTIQIPYECQKILKGEFWQRLIFFKLIFIIFKKNKKILKLQLNLLLMTMKAV